MELDLPEDAIERAIVDGVRAGKAAGMTVVLVPNHSVPPAPGTADAAGLVIAGLAELDPAAIAPAG